VGVGDPDSNDEAFGVLIFARVRLTGRFGMQEESSAPHMRLIYTHLLRLLITFIGRSQKE
jgi:hypothetical protein